MVQTKRTYLLFVLCIMLFSYHFRFFGVCIWILMKNSEIEEDDDEEDDKVIRQGSGVLRSLA